MLEIKNLTKIYGGNKKAVDNLTLSVKAGDIFGFIGSNGAGKTTTIKSIVGIHDFNDGSITINGYSIKKDPLKCKELMAYLPDNPDLYEHVSGIRYINFISDLYNVKFPERMERINKYSDIFGMTSNLGDAISSYSHGMKQKISIISALVHSPMLLILDEPFVGLDPKSAFSLKKIMKECVDDGGAIFFSTHVLDVAEKICNKIAIIKNGILITDGLTDDVRGDRSLEEIFMEIQ